MRMRVLADLPNQTGFRFTGVTHDGVKINCVVEKNAVGCHSVYASDDGEPCFCKLQGWLPL